LILSIFSFEMNERSKMSDADLKKKRSWVSFKNQYFSDKIIL